MIVIIKCLFCGERHNLWWREVRKEVYTETRTSVLIYNVIVPHKNLIVNSKTKKFLKNFLKFTQPIDHPVDRACERAVEQDRARDGKYLRSDA